MKLLSESHFPKSFLCPAPALASGDSGNGERQLYVCQHRLVHNQVITLEDETDGVIPVGIPVPVLVFSGGRSIDDEISAVISIQTTDDIEKGCLTRTAGAENGNELIVPEIETDIIQSLLHQIPGAVFFFDVLDL